MCDGSGGGSLSMGVSALPVLTVLLDQYDRDQVMYPAGTNGINCIRDCNFWAP